MQFLVSLVGLALLAAGYIAAMRATVRYSQLDDAHTASERDEVYFALHMGLIVAAAVLGFLLGKWLNGLGFAYAVLFTSVLAVGMVGVQVGSYELACEGHNDLIRHWTC